MGPAKQTTWNYSNLEWELGDFPKIMGIVNVTPDSFSDGGLFHSAQAAVDHALELVEQGADMLDIGGESTRPGADSVSEEEELKRVIPVIEKLKPLVSVPISIDTTKSSVARESLQAGATIVNDVSGLEFDPDMPSVCAESDCGVICMHMKGNPKNMQDDPVYEDVCREVLEYLEERIRFLEGEGIKSERIVLDPGIGFGKTAEHNLEIMQNISRFRETGRPVLIGHSRKRFLSKLLGRNVEERLAGTIGVSLALAQQGTDILRVHDVQSVRDALIAWKALSSNESE